MKFALTILFLLPILISQGQNISGLWAGKVEVIGGKNIALRFTYPIAFDIKYNPDSNTLSGITRTINFDKKYSNANIQGYFDSNKNHFYIEETEITETNHQWKDSVARNSFVIKFNGNNKLTGDCFCMNKEVSPFCNDKLTIRLKRKSSKKK